MKYQLSIRLVLAFAIAMTLYVLCNRVHAQGVAGSPFTIHAVQPGPQVIIGNPVPMPIDLDPSGGPWLKNIGDPNFQAPGPATIDLFETMQNVGTEAWGDWHEHLLPAPSGLPDHTWAGVVSVTINGNPITYTANISPSGLTLDLFNFSQPVMPGDIFSIHKQINTVGSGGVSGAFIRLQQYPTPAVPEPSAIVLALGALTVGFLRRC
jgi:hypothetical protein